MKIGHKRNREGKVGRRRNEETKEEREEEGGKGGGVGGKEEERGVGVGVVGKGGGEEGEKRKGRWEGTDRRGGRMK